MITKPLINLDAAREHLPMRAGVTKLDDRLAMLIDLATAQIEQLTGRKFTYQEHTQYLRTIETPIIGYDLWNTENTSGVIVSARGCQYPLLGMPVDLAEPFKVYYDLNEVYGEDTLVESGYYSLNADAGVLHTRLGTYDHPRGLKVNYTAGYAIGDDETLNDTAPIDLRLACVAQVIALWTRLSPDNIGMNSDRGQNNKNATFRQFANRGGLTPEAAGMVAHYRQPLLGLS